MNEQTLLDHVVVVTGGASGIGKATCNKLLGLGASVVLADLNPDGVANAVEALGATHDGKRIIGSICNVTVEAHLQATVSSALDGFGKVDSLVHSAGVLRPPGSAPKTMAELSVEEFDFVVDTNLKGTFLCNRAFLPTMFAQKSGHIINVASTSGRQARALDSAYCASKFGVVGLTESLAEEVRQFGIRVQLVLPDAVDTPLWEQNGPVPAPAWSLPPDRIADVIAYMLCLPPDVILGEVAVHPVRTRKRRKPKTDATKVDGKKIDER